jgi:DNA-binding CsgD family transcriptional regulator
MRPFAKDLLSEMMTATFLKSLTSRGVKNIDRLTDRELEVLELIGNGNTTREIAETLKLGIATVDTHRTRIKEKNEFPKHHRASALRDPLGA